MCRAANRGAAVAEAWYLQKPRTPVAQWSVLIAALPVTDRDPRHLS